MRTYLIPMPSSLSLHCFPMSITGEDHSSFRQAPSWRPESATCPKCHGPAVLETFSRGGSPVKMVRCNSHRFRGGMTEQLGCPPVEMLTTQ